MDRFVQTACRDGDDYGVHKPMVTTTNGSRPDQSETVIEPWKFVRSQRASRNMAYERGHGFVCASRLLPVPGNNYTW